MGRLVRGGQDRAMGWFGVGMGQWIRWYQDTVVGLGVLGWDGRFGVQGWGCSPLNSFLRKSRSCARPRGSMRSSLKLNPQRSTRSFVGVSTLWAAPRGAGRGQPVAACMTQHLILQGGVLRSWGLAAPM